MTTLQVAHLLTPVGPLLCGAACSAILQKAVSSSSLHGHGQRAADWQTHGGNVPAFHLTWAPNDIKGRVSCRMKTAQARSGPSPGSTACRHALTSNALVLGHSNQQVWVSSAPSVVHLCTQVCKHFHACLGWDSSHFLRLNGLQCVNERERSRRMAKSAAC